MKYEPTEEEELEWKNFDISTLKTSAECAAHYKRDDVAATPEQLDWMRKQLKKINKKNTKLKFDDNFVGQNMELILKRQNCFPEDYPEFIECCKNTIDYNNEKELEKKDEERLKFLRNLKVHKDFDLNTLVTIEQICEYYNRSDLKAEEKYLAFIKRNLKNFKNRYKFTLFDAESPTLELDLKRYGIFPDNYNNFVSYMAKAFKNKMIR